MLPTDKQDRKERPVARGLLDYFPDACAEVAHLSYVGNQQHNPGEELHWAREKSNDHADCIVRHLMERGTLDGDGMRHSAKTAWRALALLQLELEAEAGETEPEPEAGGGEVADVTTFGPDKPYEKTLYITTPTDPPNPEPEEVDADTQDPYTTSGILIPAQKRFRRQLEDGGCPPSHAALIAAGTSFPEHGFGQAVYLAGPMTGFQDHNFPAFDRARDVWLSKGWIVISPADIDRADGVESGVDAEYTPSEHRDFAFRDFHAIHALRAEWGEGIVLLPGWERSAGAAAEFFLARWMQLRVFNAYTGEILREVDSSALLFTVADFLASQQPQRKV